MSSPRFPTKAEATAWLIPDVIDHAVQPFLGLLSHEEIDDLRSFLDDALATHPRLRTAATRAARSLVETAGEDAGLAEAAREDEKRVPIAVPPKLLELPYEGAPDLRNPKLHATALGIIKALAKRVGKAWKAPHDDLVGVGWVVAVEIAPKWDRTKATFESYLWRCARARMLDAVKKASHRREKPCGSIYCDTIGDKDLESDQPEKRLRELTNATATSYVFSSVTPADPEEQLSRKQQRARLVAALERLPASHRALLEKTYVAGETIDVARVELGLTKATAALMHAEAMAFLREAVLEGSNVRVLRPRGTRGKP